ncbi:putative secreted protein [Thioalkalivibrio nitratireducens DSM 14787]|uniref:Secreted protein n=1 Tax=Thioalkalivibrio nitratireducens (strain DSM 14787 / UNIQEM 213 / ALEN2) TaxID=1255043 RepID=L0E0Q4_THIND|nr:putative secreted protein [Thioalkalivibrio nitratireducens DSM 14787]
MLVGDADSLWLYNIADGTLVAGASYEIADVSGVTTTEDGRFGVINVRGDGQQFRFLDSGVWVLDHVDHVHLEVDDPELLTFSINGSDHGTGRPAHVVSRDGRVALFFDGDAETDPAVAVILRRSALESGGNPPPVSLTGNGHHGLALPAAEDTVIMSVAEGEGRARTGVRIYDDGGAEIGAFPQSCPGLHGYAAIGPHYLLGCHRTDGAGGVLRITHDPDAVHPGDRFIEAQITYPEGALHISNFAYHPESPWAVAPWGTEAMIRVNPTADALSEDDILNLPARQCGYAMRDDHGQDLLVLTVDGFLHSVDVANWAVHSSMQVMTPFECAGTRPVLRSVGGFAYLTRPADSDLIEIDLDHDGEITQAIELTEPPVRMTLFRHPASLVDYGDH